MNVVPARSIGSNLFHARRPVRRVMALVPMADEVEALGDRIAGAVQSGHHLMPLIDEVLRLTSGRRAAE